MKKVKNMLFSRSRGCNRSIDPIEAQVSSAIQRNELASEKAREALEAYKMTQTIDQLARRM